MSATMSDTEREAGDSGGRETTPSGAARYTRRVSDNILI